MLLASADELDDLYVVVVTDECGRPLGARHHRAVELYRHASGRQPEVAEQRSDRRLVLELGFLPIYVDFHDTRDSAVVLSLQPRRLLLSA
jgi:hypothetical protein